MLIGFVELVKNMNKYCLVGVSLLQDVILTLSLNAPEGVTVNCLPGRSGKQEVISVF